jgi:hypothetical protein
MDANKDTKEVMHGKWIYGKDAVGGSFYTRGKG